MGKALDGKDLGKGLSQRKDGKYSARFTDRFGKRVQEYGDSIPELKKWLAKQEALNNLHLNVVESNMILNDWFGVWYKEYKYNSVAETTKVQYLNVYNKHIAPVLGKMKVSAIKQFNILSLINKLDKEGYRYETKNKVRIMLLDMFNKAMENDYLLKNPARGIRLNRDEKTEPRFLTVEEQKTFFDCSKGSFYDNLFVVAVNTGLRPGEVCALTENDLDFEKRTISVSKTLVYQKLENDTGKTFHFEKPKTTSSKRTVPMTRACEMALKKQIMQSNVLKARSKKKLADEFSELIFLTQHGQPVCVQNIIDAIDRVVKEINFVRDETEQMESFSGHTFRHTFASNCYREGFDLKEIQRLLGHANLQMTANLYVHVFEDKLNDSIDNLSNAMDRLNAMDMYDNINKKFEEKKAVGMSNIISIDRKSR